MKRLFISAAAAALSLAITGSANAAVFAFSSNNNIIGNGGNEDTYSLTVSGLTVTVKGFGSLGTSVNLNDQDDVTWSNGNGIGVDGGSSDNNPELDDGEGLLLDFGQVVNLTQAQFAAWSAGQDDADYRYSSSPFNSGSLTDISSNLTSNGGTATWNPTGGLTGRYFFFAAIDEGQGDNDKFWLKNVTASAVQTTPGPGSAVPEPATWAMMILGFGLAGSQIRRAVREKRTVAAY